MAAYKIRINPNGDPWPEDQPTYYHRRSSRDGRPCAQPVFDARQEAGLFAELVVWAQYKGAGHEAPAVLDTTG